jgi:hypothetical protein
MADINKVLSESRKIMDWYYREGCHSLNIPLLIENKSKLSGITYYLSEVAADLKYDYNNAYFLRKIEVAKSKQGFMNEGKTASMSEAMSITQNTEYNKVELEKEAHAYKADLMLKSIYCVINSMTQQVAYLRKELDLTAQN